jgi:hypothetical protein
MRPQKTVTLFTNTFIEVLAKFIFPEDSYHSFEIWKFNYLQIVQAMFL